MKDVDKAREIVQKTAGEIGLEQSTLDTTLKLLDEYDKARESVFKEMVELTTKSDVSDLLSEWKELCDKGRDQLRKLNDISPGNGIGVVMVGLSKFQTGEFKVWDQNAKSEIARAVVDTKLIYQANLKLIQTCNQELQDFASQKKDLLERVAGPFAATKDVLLGHFTMRVKATGKLSRSQWVHVWKVEEGEISYMREYVDTLAVSRAYNLADHLEAASLIDRPQGQHPKMHK